MKDPYSDPDSQEAVTLEAMITRLEERGQHPRFASMVERYASSLPQDRPLKVLEIGCGTGVILRQVAKSLHPDSVLHGADISQSFLNKAQLLDTSGKIQWDHQPAGQLTYDSGSFDAVILHTLLSHVPDPDVVLQEVARVLKPKGQLIMFDADHAGTTYGLPEYTKMRQIDFTLTSAIATHPDICRQLPRLLQSSNFHLQQHHSEIISECGKGEFWLSSVQGFAKMIPKLGILTPEDTEYWTNHMLSSHEKGTFFAAGAFYTFFAER